jgi:hypothetical protein
LKDAGSQFKKVYSAAESADSRLSKKVIHECNKIGAMNLKLSAYSNINRNAAVFSRNDFSRIIESRILSTQ